MTIREMLGSNLPGFEIIDIHAHMNRPAQFMCPGDPDIAGMIATMDRVGIDRIAIAPNMAINCDCTLGNRMVLEAARRYPDRVIGLATVNLNHLKESMDSLEECFKTSFFKGIKFHPDFLHYSVQQTDLMQTVLDFARQRKIFLISHTDERVFPGHLVRYSDPEWFERYIRDYPDLNFVLAHCGLSSGGYRTCLRLVLENDNVYLDTTGFRFSDRWTVDDLARHDRANRVVFGTDIPFNDIGSAGGRIIMSQLPLADRIMMLGGNAKRLLNEL
jgi:predicted TIM-barrel fold metal-dependent hydrolase